MIHQDSYPLPLTETIVAEMAACEVFGTLDFREIAFKAGKGRLLLPEPPRDYVLRRLALHGFRALAVEACHALEVYDLPALHSDPFDRLLIAQSRVERLPLLSVDPEVARYDVEVIW